MAYISDAGLSKYGRYDGLAGMWGYGDFGREKAYGGKGRPKRPSKQQRQKQLAPPKLPPKVAEKLTKPTAQPLLPSTPTPIQVKPAAQPPASVTEQQTMTPIQPQPAIQATYTDVMGPSIDPHAPPGTSQMYYPGQPGYPYAYYPQQAAMLPTQAIVAAPRPAAVVGRPMMQAMPTAQATAPSSGIAGKLAPLAAAVAAGMLFL